MSEVLDSRPETTLETSDIVMTGPNDFNQSAVRVKTFSKVPTKIKILFCMWTSFDTQRLRIQSTSPEVSAASTKIDFSKFCHLL